MFNTLNFKFKLILGGLFFALLIAIVTTSTLAFNFYAKAKTEKLKKEMWQTNYIALNQKIDEFSQKQTALFNEVRTLQKENEHTERELNNAIENNQNWSNQPVPDDVRRLLNKTNQPANSLPANSNVR
ncbi:TPA: hypothetical protein SIC60_001983 [Pasteurella multocida]|uniref:hypothetical protein n=1 Tax=Pasteurella multocida TaxID=747 RepID=UPI0029A7EDD4|nr:hypothetical protein [Pasteurella multocida]HEH9732821.1 hypothetical protein [Pasteurella multocida]